MNLTTLFIILTFLNSLLTATQNQFNNLDVNNNLKNPQQTINQNNNKSPVNIDSQNIDQQNNHNEEQNNNDEKDFLPASGTNTIYYLKILLEGIEEQRATSVPELRMDGDLYCNDQYRAGIRARDIRPYATTQISVPNDCNKPAVLLNIPYWLNIYVYLTSNDENNPQDVFFKGGDVNKDNKIDDFDLSEVLLTFGQDWTYSTTSSKNPDVNLEGRIDNKDLEIILNNFGAYGSVGPTNYSLIIKSNDLNYNRNNNIPIPNKNLIITSRCSGGKESNYSYPNYTLGDIVNLDNLPYDCNQPQIIKFPIFRKGKLTYPIIRQ